MTYLLDVRAVRARLEAPELRPALAGSGTP
jgi:hypothetical protein